MLIGAINYFNDEANQIKSPNGGYEAVPIVARSYKAKGIGTLVVGDETMVKAHHESMLRWNLDT